jgi:ankyrin repeat protein
VNTIEALIDRGANVRAEAATGATALHDAAYFGRTDALAALLKSDDSAVDTPTTDGVTPLHFAAQEGQASTVGWLLGGGGGGGIV